MVPSVSQFDAIVPPILSQHAKAIAASLEPCFDLTVSPLAAAPQPLASRLYGSPFLHHVGDWPRNPEGQPLAFIGQVHLQELERESHPQLAVLPAAGLLSLFFDLDAAPDGGSPDDRYRFRLLWTPDTREGKTVTPPLGAVEIGAPWAIAAAPATRLPAEGDAGFCLGQLSEAEFLAYDALACRLAPPCEHRLLGPADWLTDDARDLCARATERLWPGGAWRLLWQVGGEPYLAAALGGEARLYVLIREEDLAERRFLRCWVILQRS